MEEENQSFSLTLEFLEPQVEEENEIEQCEITVLQFIYRAVMMSQSGMG